MKVICRNCRKTKKENEMKIYDVHSDAYFCDQDCFDEKNGLVRDKEGCVVSDS